MIRRKFQSLELPNSLEEAEEEIFKVRDEIEKSDFKCPITCSAKWAVSTHYFVKVRNSYCLSILFRRETIALIFSIMLSAKSFGDS